MFYYQDIYNLINFEKNLKINGILKKQFSNILVNNFVSLCVFGNLKKKSFIVCNKKLYLQIL